MKYYDYIFSLGRSCHTAISLKTLFLIGESDVFDWSGGVLFDKCGVGGFEGKVNLICNNFENFLNIEDFEEFEHAPNNKHKNIRNRHTGLQYLHDFPRDVPLEEEFPNFCEKYQRRISRLYKKLEEANSVCFVFITWEEYISDDLILKAQNKLNEKFNNKIDILVLQNDNTLEDGVCFKEVLSNKSMRIKFNNLCAPCDSGRYNYKLYQKIIQNELCSSYKLTNLDIQEQQKKLFHYVEFTKCFKDKLTDLEIMQFSPLFDEEWYKDKYLNGCTDISAIEHYFNYGWKLGYNPSLKFDGNEYLKIHTDVKKIKLNPLLHYLKWGVNEGRKMVKVK